MPVFALPLLCIVVLVVGLVFYRKGDRELEAAREGLRSALTARGLTVTGNLDRPELPPGLDLRRTDGARARFPENLALGATNPLTAPQLRGAVIVDATLPLTDQVVCELSLAQPVFGAFPPPPVPTGDAAFDARFGIFPAPAAGPAQSHDYRSLSAGLASWATPEVRAALIRTGFVALRTSNGQAQLAFSPTSPDGMALAIATADAMGAAAVGRPASSLGSARPAGLVASQGMALGFVFATAIAITLAGTATRSALTFQDAHEDAWFTLGGNTAGCPDGGRYSAGPGYRKQHRTHYCYQTDGKKTPANEALLMLWTWGSFGAAGVGALLVGRGIHASSKAAGFRRGTQALGS